MCLAGQVDVMTVDVAVRPSEVDELENTQCVPGFGMWIDAPDAFLADDDNFAGIKLADELGLDKVQSAGFGSQHVVAVQFAEA